MERGIIFFDGVCNLCNSAVQFVIQRDAKDYFRFAALQSEQAQEYLDRFAVDFQAMDSILLLEDGKLYRRSSAALRITKHLGGLWPVLYILIYIPAFIRDFFYKLISGNRYKIWGKRTSCMVPTPDLEKKFL